MLCIIPLESQQAAVRVTGDVFTAFLNCQHKAYLLLKRQIDKKGTNGVPTFLHQNPAPDIASYRRAAFDHYRHLPAYKDHGIPDRPVSIGSTTYKRLQPETPLDDPRSLFVELINVPTPRGRSKILHVPLLPILSEQTSKHDKLLLTFAGILLDKSGHTVAPFGRIVHGRSFQVTRVQIHMLNRDARRLLVGLDAVFDDTAKPRLLLNPHCNVCAFRQHCRDQAIENDDLSLVSSLSKKEILSLNKRGIFTVTQLSYLYRPNRRRHGSKLSGKHSKQNLDKHMPSLKALAIRERKIYVKDPPDLPKRQVDIYLDVEGLPDEGFYYLIGIIVRDGSTDTTHSFWANTAADEERIWRKFVAVVERLQDYTIFHYGNYEVRWLRAMLNKYDLGVPAIADCVSKSMVNVLSHCYQHIYFPTYSNGLKDIGHYLGYQWEEPDASGMQSIQWRKTWEDDHSADVQRRLIQYNQQDCEALCTVVTAIREIIEHGRVGNHPIALAGDAKSASPYGLGKNKFAFPEFDYINKCAYFDYQRTKIYWRTDKKVKRLFLRSRAKVSKRQLRINAVVQCSAKKCISCKHTALRIERSVTKIVRDLKFVPSGVKVWGTKYVSNRYRCLFCDLTFLPRTYPKNSAKLGHGVLAWVVYNKIGLRQTDESVRHGLNDLFGFGIAYPIVFRMKARAEKYYKEAYSEIVQRLRLGPLVHVDETKVNVKGGSGYVWVFTNLEEVLYVYSGSREGKIVSETLGNFKGVLVSDFYSAYDGFEWQQQRCLVHLIRDLNDDVFDNPFDSEYKVFVGAFGKMFKAIVDTIDRYGLKRRFLVKHKKDVRRFFRTYIEIESTSEQVQKYQDRFKRNERRLFTFLDYDGVPWNNNNAENAIKAFAAVRNGAEGLFTEKGLIETLQMLSISQTLRNKDRNFLGFLKSGKKSLMEYCDDRD